MRVSSVVFCGGRNVKIILFKSGTSNTGKADARAAGYRPRGYSICIIEEMDWKSRGNYSEIVDCVISRMQLEHLKKRVEEIFTEVDKELIFRSMKHRNDFYSLLMGKRFGTCKCGNIYSEKLPHPSEEGEPDEHGKVRYKCIPVLCGNWKQVTGNLLIAEGENFVEALRSGAFLTCIYEGKITVIGIPEKEAEERKKYKYLHGLLHMKENQRERVE